jgi:hypothetical protein
MDEQWEQRERTIYARQPPREGVDWAGERAVPQRWGATSFPEASHTYLRNNAWVCQATGGTQLGLLCTLFVVTYVPCRQCLPCDLCAL